MTLEGLPRDCEAVSLRFIDGAPAWAKQWPGQPFVSQVIVSRCYRPTILAAKLAGGVPIGLCSECSKLFDEGKSFSPPIPNLSPWGAL